MRNMKLSNNPFWRGGRTISSQGYIRLKMPNHPSADVAGYVYEHRLIAEQVLGRQLKKDELVHHKGTKYPKGSIEDKQDNRPINLLITQGIAGHKLEHRKRKDLKVPGQSNPIILCACGCGTPFMKYDSNNRPRVYIRGHNRRGNLSWNPKKTVECTCGCGQYFFEYDRQGRPRKFINGHNTNIVNPNPYARL